jgi:hypothetical protein
MNRGDRGKAGTATRYKNVSGAADGGESRRGGARAVLFLFAVLLFIFQTACNWELTAYRIIAEAQVGYDTYWRTIVELHAQGAGSEAYYAQAEAVATRLFNLGKSATQLMVEYKKIGDPATKAKINAAIRELPTLVASLVQFAEGLRPRPAKPAGKLGAPYPHDAVSVAKFERRTLPKLQRIDADLGEIEALQNTEAAR